MREQVCWKSEKAQRVISSIYEVLEPLYKILRVFGSIVFTLTSSEESKFKVRRANWVHLGISSGVLLAFFILNINVDLYTYKTRTDIVSTMMRYILIMGILVVIETTLSNRVLQKFLWKLLKCLHHFDNMMVTVNAPIDHPLHGKWIIRMVVAIGVVCFLFGTFNVGTITMISSNKLLGFFASLTYTIITVAFTMYVSHFIAILMNIRARFCTLNRSFKNHFSTNDFLRIVPNSSEESCTFITSLSKLHDCLNDGVTHANGYFAVPMLITLTCVLAYIVVTIFTIYCVLTSDHTALDLLTAIAYGVDCGFYSFFLIAVIAIASDLTYQGKYTSTLIHKAINRTEDDKVAEKLKVWSLQLLHRQPVVTCGLFSYDWTLFYSIVAATCAYVTILIQFDTTKFYSEKAFNATQ